MEMHDACEAQGDAMRCMEMCEACDDSMRCDGLHRLRRLCWAMRGSGGSARKCGDALCCEALHQVMGPASTGCDAVKSPAQSIELRCFVLRGHGIVSGMPPVGDVLGCICRHLQCFASSCVKVFHANPREESH